MQNIKARKFKRAVPYPWPPGRMLPTRLFDVVHGHRKLKIKTEVDWESKARCCPQSIACCIGLPMGQQRLSIIVLKHDPKSKKRTTGIQKVLKMGPNSARLCFFHRELLKYFP